MNTSEHYANLLRTASSNMSPIPALRDEIGISDLDFAYAIQKFNTDKKVKAGAKITGKKIGLTSFAVQKQLGVDQPDFGVLFDDMEVDNGGEISFEKLMQPKIEGEIAFILKEDLSETILNQEHVLAAVEYVLPALEIVGSRIENWNIRITDTIADNASASHYVLGSEPIKLESLNLAGCQMKLFRNGQLESEGTGKDCMDSPLNAFLWLAQKMVDMGTPLKAGEIVLSGALGPMVNVLPGDRFKLEISDLGGCSLLIS